MKIIQLTLITLIFSFGFLNMIHAQESKLLDKVVAQVGGEFILLSEIELQYSYIKETYPREVHPLETRCMLLEDRLAQSLLVNQAHLDSVVVSNEEVDLQLDARIDRILAMMGNDREMFKNEYGMTPEEVKEDQRPSLKNQILAERMQMRVMADVRATPSEVIEFFNSIPRDSLPFYNSEVQISELVIVPKANQEEKDRALNRITDLRNQIISGERTFEELARTFSDDPGSARMGGSLGWQSRGTFVPEFEATVYNLEAGEISDPIETEFGYHIIKLLERRGNSVNAKHILIHPRITSDDLLLAKNHLDSVRNIILRDSIPYESAVRIFGNDQVQSYSNGGRVVNNATGNTFFEVGELDPDIYFAIFDLEVGEISDVVEFRDRSGETVYKIFKLLSRTRPHRANLQEDFAKIKDMATEYKRATQFNEWLLDKLSGTYIRIDKSFHSCPNIEFWLSESDITRRP
ncbi:MAG: peptidylprolyl isomerase [Saprospirales bacterium]|nr:MAG: peptidylprolyl isomerase [Saprospirales bacterium]